MRTIHVGAALALCATLSCKGGSEGPGLPSASEGFRPLLDGTDWTGWGKPAGADAAHWTRRQELLACESPAAPLWTEQAYADCELALDVRAVEGRPSAVVHARGPRGFEVAVQCKPDGQWSHLRARIRGDEIDVDIDGEPSQGKLPGVRASGALGLSSEGPGRLEFAKLRVRETR